MEFSRTRQVYYALFTIFISFQTRLFTPFNDDFVRVNSTFIPKFHCNMAFSLQYGIYLYMRNLLFHSTFNFYGVEWNSKFHIYAEFSLTLLITVLRHLSQREHTKPSHKGLALDGAKKKCYTIQNKTSEYNCSWVLRRR